MVDVHVFQYQILKDARITETVCFRYIFYGICMIITSGIQYHAEAILKLLCIIWHGPLLDIHITGSCTEQVVAGWTQRQTVKTYRDSNSHLQGHKICAKLTEKYCIAMYALHH